MLIFFNIFSVGGARLSYNQFLFPFFTPGVVGPVSQWVEGDTKTTLSLPETQSIFSNVGLQDLNLIELSHQTGLIKASTSSLWLFAAVWLHVSKTGLVFVQVDTAAPSWSSFSFSLTWRGDPPQLFSLVLSWREILCSGESDPFIWRGNTLVTHRTPNPSRLHKHFTQKHHMNSFDVVQWCKDRVSFGLNLGFD